MALSLSELSVPWVRVYISQHTTPLTHSHTHIPYIKSQYIDVCIYDLLGNMLYGSFAGLEHNPNLLSVALAENNFACDDRDNPLPEDMSLGYVNINLPGVAFLDISYNFYHRCILDDSFTIRDPGILFMENYGEGWLCPYPGLNNPNNPDNLTSEAIVSNINTNSLPIFNSVSSIILSQREQRRDLNNPNNPNVQSCLRL